MTTSQPMPGPRPARPRTRLAIAALLLALAACHRGGIVIDKLDLRDLPVPGMVLQVASTVHRPFLIELPPQPGDAHYDLSLRDVSLEQALSAIGKLDPAYRLEMRDGVVVLWPSGKAGDESPFSRRVPSLAASGGVGEVMRLLLVQSGLADTTSLSVDIQGLHRPVTLEVHDVTVRDALIDLQRQAHLAIQMEQGTINVQAVAE